MTYTIFTLLYTVISGAIFLSCMMIALFRRKPPMFVFAYSFGCTTASAMVYTLQTADNRAVTALMGNFFFLGSNLLLYYGTRLFYEGRAGHWARRFWGYLGFGMLAVFYLTVVHYDIVSRAVFMALYTSLIFADFAHYLRRFYYSMLTPIRAAFVVALTVTEASFIGRIIIVMQMQRLSPTGVRIEDLNIYTLTSYVVTSVFWLATLILVDDARMMEDLQRQNRILEPMAHTDKLTGLFNRYKLYEIINDYMNLTRRLERPLTFILLDIDHFKEINDTYGHAAGDQVLVRLAEVIRTNVRATDRVFRWGGEEFLVLAVGTPADGGVVMAENLRQRVAATEFPAAGWVTASFGVAEQLPHGGVEDWFHRTDLALYQAKKAGRNQVMKWDGRDWPAGMALPDLAGFPDHFGSPACDRLESDATVALPLKAGQLKRTPRAKAPGTAPDRSEIKP